MAWEGFSDSALRTWQEVDVFISYFIRTTTENEIQLLNEARLGVIENLATHQPQTQNVPQRRPVPTGLSLDFSFQTQRWFNFFFLLAVQRGISLSTICERACSK